MFRQNVVKTRTWISDEEFLNSPKLDGEVWIDFDEYKGIKLSSVYQASNKGRIRRKGKSVIKGAISFDGYHELDLSIKGAGGKVLPIRVHIVILTILQGPPPSDMSSPTVQHINHDKLDNRIENLCWMSAFENNQERHGTRTKIIDDSGEHIFGSQKAASEYIGRYEDYISECIRNKYRPTSSTGSKFRLFIENDTGEWEEFLTPITRNRTRCKLIKNGEAIEFDSFGACDLYLNRHNGYVSTMYANDWPIIPNEEHEFYIWNFECMDYIRYDPKHKKTRNHSSECKVIINEEEQILPSMSAAARLINRDSEYVRIAIKENKPIISSDGVRVTIIRLDN